MHLNTVFLVLVVTTAVVAVKRSYEGYKVYKVVPKTKDEVQTLEALQRGAIVELWEDYFDVHQDVRMVVSPQKQETFLEKLKQKDMEAIQVFEDLQKIIDDQLKPAKQSTRNAQDTTFYSLNWERYFNLEQIYAWLDELESAYPNVVTTINMGQSVEGRDIKGIKIDYKPGNNLYVGMFEGGIHAREWISPATITWIIKEFLTSSDPDVRSLAENIQWHIFPVVNPDGYSYTFTDNRMWRKNRSTRNYTSCVDSGVSDDLSNGVDLNRNFDYVWMNVGASDNPCLNTFAGPSPASEPETQAISEYVMQLKEQYEMIYYFSFHSYSQLIIAPYSHLYVDDAGQPNNLADLLEIATRGANALSERFGTNYRVGVSEQVMYFMSGTSFDWVKNATDVPVSLLFELRDLGDYGFLLPTEEIVSNNLEIMDALIEIDKTTKQLGYYESGVATLNPFVVLLLCAIFTILSLNRV